MNEKRSLLVTNKEIRNDKKLRSNKKLGHSITFHFKYYIKTIKKRDKVIEITYKKDKAKW